MKIYKYGPFVVSQQFELPGRPVYFAIQHKQAFVWCEVMDEKATSLHTIVGTGWDFEGEHRATLMDGPYVWHLVCLNT